VEGPRSERLASATSAAACSAWRSVVHPPGPSKVSPLKVTAARKRGAWSGPSRVHTYDGSVKQLLCANSCSWFLYIPPSTYLAALLHDTSYLYPTDRSLVLVAHKILALVLVAHVSEAQSEEELEGCVRVWLLKWWWRALCTVCVECSLSICIYFSH
jgi:hypothetical protein